MKLALVVTVGVGMIVILSVASVWAPSTIIAMEALKEISENSMATRSRILAEQVTGYFTDATSVATTAARLYNISSRNFADNALFHLIDSHGEALWSLLSGKPNLASLLLTHVRSPESMNYTPPNNECDMDGFLISSVYVSEFTVRTLGTSPTDCPPTGPRPCEGRARVSRLGGSLSDPLARAGVLFDPLCKDWISGAKFRWRQQEFPGNLSEWDSGLREPTWLRGTLTAGKYPNDALYMTVTVPLLGPSWGPLSASATLSVRVGQAQVSQGAGVISIPKLLKEAVLLTNVPEVLFILTERGQILATSEDLDVEKRKPNGPLIGLIDADDPSIPPAVRKLTSQLVQRYCTTQCNWKRVPEVLHSSDVWAVSKVIEDPLAKGLHMLLVDMVREEEVLKPATALNKQLAAIASTVLVVCCLAAFVFARWLSSPVIFVAREMDQAASMVGLDGVVHRVAMRSKTCIEEINTIMCSLKELASRQVEFKCFLPQAIFTDNIEEDCNSSVSHDPRKSLSSTLSTSMKKPPTQTGVKVKQVAVMTINLADWGEKAMLHIDWFQRESSEYISALAAESDKGKGTLGPFNGDRAIVTWNATGMRMFPTKLAVQTALSLGEHYASAHRGWNLFGSGMGVAVTVGKVLCGTTGSERTRSFNVCGPPVGLAWKLCEFATSLVNTLEPSRKYLPLISKTATDDVTGVVSTYAFGLAEFKGAMRQVYEIIGEQRFSGGGEWMYQMNTEETKTGARLDEAFFAVLKDPSALEEYTTLLIPRFLRLGIPEDPARAAEALEAFKWRK